MKDSKRKWVAVSVFVLLIGVFVGKQTLMAHAATIAPTIGIESAQGSGRGTGGCNVKLTNAMYSTASTDGNPNPSSYAGSATYDGDPYGDTDCARLWLSGTGPFTMDFRFGVRMQNPKQAGGWGPWGWTDWASNTLGAGSSWSPWVGAIKNVGSDPGHAMYQVAVQTRPLPAAGDTITIAKVGVQEGDGNNQSVFPYYCNQNVSGQFAQVFSDGVSNGGWTTAATGKGPDLSFSGVGDVADCTRVYMGGGAITVAPPPPSTPVGTITVTSENVNSPSTLVNASWDITGQASTIPGSPNGSFVCSTLNGVAWQGVPCSGTQQTYSGVSANNTTYTMPPSAKANVPGYTLRSVEQVPIAQKNDDGILSQIKLSLNNFFSTPAFAVEYGVNDGTLHLNANSYMLTSTKNSVGFVILWTPNADLQVNGSNPIALTPTSLSQTVTVQNDGTPGSQLDWTATKSSTSGGNWFNISSTGGSIQNGNSGGGGGNTNGVTVTAVSGLAAGTYTGTITFTGTDYNLRGASVPSSPKTIQVSLSAPQYYSCASNVCQKTSTPGATSCASACGGGAPLTASCTPASILLGDTSQCVVDLGTAAQNATWSVVSGASGSIDASSGVFTASAPGTETVKGTLADGSSANATITVQNARKCKDASCQAVCNAPTLTANPTAIVVPESTTLSYGCSHVTDCKLYRSGTVAPIQEVGGGALQTVNSTYSDTPPITTTYTVTCENTSNNYVSDSATVSVQVTVGGTVRCEQNPNGVGCPAAQ